MGVMRNMKKKELALYAIELKMAETIKTNTSHNYSELQGKLLDLKEEKMKIYKNNTNAIDEAISKYLPNTTL